LSAAGLDGFVVGGTTGEGAYLSTAEKGEVLGAIRNVIDSKQPICAAYIGPSTALVLEQIKALQSTGPDFIVAVTPYYLSMRQEDIIEHFRIISNAATSPLILCNIPGNTHNPISLETILELSQMGNIVGIKDPSGQFIDFCRGILSGSQSDFA
jgi:4-hydroxy-tetrahydrodipicolinate synthase